VPALALAELGRGKHASGNATALLDTLVGALIQAGATARDGQLAELAALSKYEESVTSSVASLKEALEASDRADDWCKESDQLLQAAQGTKQGIRTVIMGPAASGKALTSNTFTEPNPQMRQPPKTLATAASFIDVLVFGQRRWVMFGNDRLETLRKKAGDDFKPSTAYQFFESQYVELKEEYGLEFSKDGKAGGAWECNQGTGDALFVPADGMLLHISVYIQSIFRSMFSVQVSLN
jgi:hypothetical protein